MHHELRPRDSLSIHCDAERQLVKGLLQRYRSLPEDRRRKMPALLNAIGQLQLAAGDFGEAERHFKEVTTLVTEPAARGVAYLNAYRAALEQQKQDLALEELLKAVKLDGKRFAPFPVGKYHPKRILGAGGFGVAFLCRHKELDADVVVKALHGEGFDRGVDEILAEARLLYQLDHPCIVRLLDCGYTAPSTKSRPYFVMSYFAGATLEDRVRRRVLSVDEGLEVARLMADGLQAAHAKGILHRDVKPANVLVRKDNNGWQVKLIDFGLAMRTEASRDTLRGATLRRHPAQGSDIAGTAEYAAPVQMGRLPGVPVAFYSDLYGWAKTCCFALFGTAQPLPKHWSAIPDHLAGVLGQCLEEDPHARPVSCAEVLDRLDLANRRNGGARLPSSLPNAIDKILLRLRGRKTPPVDCLEEVEEVAETAAPRAEDRATKEAKRAGMPGKRPAAASAESGGCAVNAVPPREWQSNRQTIGMMAIFLGSFGIHKFMLGNQQPALVMLAVSLVGLFCVLGVGWYVMIVFGIIEGIKYLNMSDEEFYCTYVIGKKQWF